MSNIVTRIVDITDMKRINSSPSGNPCWQIETNVGTYRTEHDAMFAYVITGNERGKAVIGLNKRNEIISFML